MTTVYVALPAPVWDRVRAEGRLSHPHHFGDDCPRVLEFVRDQLVKRVQCDPCDVVPVYCHPTKKDAIRWWSRAPRVVLLDVVAPALLPFDDHMFVHACNGPLNPHFVQSFLGWSRAEEEEREQNATPEECMASCERMFEIDSAERDGKWRGPPLVRAFIPRLTLAMVLRSRVLVRGKRPRKK